MSVQCDRMRMLPCRYLLVKVKCGESSTIDIFGKCQPLQDMVSTYSSWSLVLPISDNLPTKTVQLHCLVVTHRLSISVRLRLSCAMSDPVDRAACRFAAANALNGLVVLEGGVGMGPEFHQRRRRKGTAVVLVLLGLSIVQRTEADLCCGKHPVHPNRA